MEISKSFETAIITRDISKVRIMLKNSLFVDTTFSKFNAMFELAKDLPGLFDEHDDRGVPFQPQSGWTKDYADLLGQQLIPNFSSERLEHLKEVAKFVYPKAVPAKPKEEKRDDTPLLNMFGITKQLFSNFETIGKALLEINNETDKPSK
ncbi:MAG: hypothetical protein FWG64_07255 [Firmicutes bacterium]|nr:hypothetical protein [Bacillota bacterium]